MPELLSWGASKHTRHPKVRRRRHAAPGAVWRIRTSLALLVIACLLPGILMSAWLVVSDYQQHKKEAIHSAIATARTAAASLDRDIASVTAGLRVLATSNALMADDLAAFHARALNALPYCVGCVWWLIDEAGRQQLNTLKPWGSPLPVVGGPPQLQRIFEKDTPVLTDLFVGPVTGKPILALGVPVKRNGRVVYSLNAGIFPSRFSAVLSSQHLPKDWIGAILDSRGTLVARTHDMEHYVGKPAVPDLVRMAQLTPEGMLETVTLEGIPVITVFSRSHVSDWTVAVGIPQAQLTGSLQQSLITLLIVSILAFFAAVWVAWHLAVTRVVNPANRLLNRMQAMARGEAPGPIDTHRTPHEFLMLEQGFADMAGRLAEREQEREAKLAAEAANRAKTAFLSRMSHELRTPLNAVLGFTQVLLMDDSDPLSVRQHGLVQHIDTSGRHLLDMIGDVLDVSRIESGQMHIELDIVDAAGLLQACQEMMAPEASAKGLHLQVSIHGDVGQIRADRLRLKQVLLNLLSNAIKYNRPQGSVVLDVRREGSLVRFAVRDTGLGMSPEQITHLFEPFNRLGRHHAQIPGVGIGLVICKQLLELMGSTLLVHSEPGQGSEFQFDLPLAS